MFFSTEADPNMQLTGESKAEPWKTLLELPARAAWRVTAPHPPKALNDAQQSILDEAGRNNKYLKKIYKQIVSAHRSLAERRDRERLRALKDLEYKKTDMRRDSGIEPVLYGPEETLAAFTFRLLPNYAVVKRVLEESRSLIGYDAWSPKRVLDFGVGCGSASAASLDVWGDIEWIHGIDPSQSMREGAKTFLDEFSEHEEKEGCRRITMSAHLSSEASPPAFDLALFAYTATELPHNASTLAAAAVLWEKLRPNGLFVMVEPGTPDGFSSVRTVRNMLLHCCPPDREKTGVEECHTIAPCTHNGPCPMERFQRPPKERRSPQLDVEQKDSEDDSDIEENSDSDDESGIRRGFCSFVQTMPGKEGSSKGEKFAYIVAQKRTSCLYADAPHRFENESVTGLLDSILSETDPIIMERLSREAINLEDRFLDSDDDDLGLELLRGDLKRLSFGRIIHAPKKKKGHILIDCCTAPGRIVRHKVSKSLSKSSPGIYAAARKSRWGGYWPDVEGTEADNG